MKKKILLIPVAILLAISLVATGCPPPVPDWADQKEKLEAQLNFVTTELASVRAELGALKREYKELKTLVPPPVEVEPVTIDPEKTALMIVDMQNDFVKLGGALGPVDKAGEQANMEYVTRIRALLEKARDAGMPIIYTQDYHYPDDPEFALWGPHVLSGTWGVEIIPELAPKPGDIIVRKGGKFVSYCVWFASWEPNEMEKVLEELGVNTVIVVGTVSHICVYAAVVGSAQRGFSTIVPRDCILTLPFWPWGERFALFQFSALYAVTVTQSDMITFK
jgi:nicotinamidase-related amidase